MGVTSSTDHLPPLLISPAEPAWLKEKLASRFHLLSTARLTESRGVDVAWLVEGDAADQTGQSDAWWGVQRKTVDDLIASVGDRLTREVGQMTAATGVEFPYLLIEGQVRFASNGLLLRDGWGQEFTKKQWTGLIWSIQRAGIAVGYAGTRGDLAEHICDLYAWSQKARHQSLRQRVSAPTNDWGTRTNREWARWILQGFDGIGPGLADEILDVIGMPLTWTVDEGQLMKVPGIGKVRARKLIEALRDKSEPGREAS